MSQVTLEEAIERAKEQAAAVAKMTPEELIVKAKELEAAGSPLFSDAPGANLWPNPGSEPAPESPAAVTAQPPSVSADVPGEGPAAPRPSEASPAAPKAAGEPGKKRPPANVRGTGERARGRRRYVPRSRRNPYEVRLADDMKAWLFGRTP